MESLFAYSGNSIRNGNRNKVRLPIKCKFSYGLQTLGQAHRNEICATIIKLLVRHCVGAGVTQVEYRQRSHRFQGSPVLIAHFHTFVSGDGQMGDSLHIVDVRQGENLATEAVLLFQGDIGHHIVSPCTLP